MLEEEEIDSGEPILLYFMSFYCFYLVWNSPTISLMKDGKERQRSYLPSVRERKRWKTISWKIFNQPSMRQKLRWLMLVVIMRCLEGRQ